MHWSAFVRTASRPRARSVLAVALLLLTITLARGDSNNGDLEGPDILCPDAVCWGCPLYGLTVDLNGPIVVTGTLNGFVTLPGSPDDSSTENSNSFCFPVPRGSGRGSIKITATDSLGNSTVKYVTVIGLK